ncbi:MAG: DUF262 domain-containing protein [Magnetococcales bacterium]|nr:DUF262 domain-containing protein [Magnetococcales bacterium]
MDSSDSPPSLDPRQVKIETKQVTLASLIKRMREGRIGLDAYQRLGTWSRDAQSRLIESMLIRIPLPSFCMDVANEEGWVVVDGLQRLLAVRDFILPQDPGKGLLLQGLDFLKDLERKGFTDLPRHYQRRIEETEITLFLIEKGTPEPVRDNIHKRFRPNRFSMDFQTGLISDSVDQVDQL